MIVLPIFFNLTGKTVSEHCKAFAVSLLLVLAAAPASGETLVGGVIDADTVWRRADQPFIVTSTVHVRASQPDQLATLTIEPGVTVKFRPGTGLVIGGSSRQPGRLVARGGDTAKIAFVADDQGGPSPAPWAGIAFSDGATDNDTVLEGCRVERTRQNGQRAAIFVNSSAPQIRDCTISRSQHHGIRISNSAASRPLLAGNIIEESAQNGVHSDGDAARPVLSGNVIRQNGGNPLVVPVASVSDIDAQNRFSGNGRAEVVVVGARLNGIHRWVFKGPFVFQSGLGIRGNRDQPAAELTLLPGTTLRFSGNTRLRVGGSTRELGRLIAEGTEDEPIQFTGGQERPGFWHGLFFDQGARGQGNRLVHCRVAHGGQSQRANIVISASDPLIDRCKISDSSEHGIRLFANDGRPLIEASEIIDNAGNGIHADNNVPQPTVNASVISRNQGTGLVIPAGAVRQISADTVISGNGNNSIRAHGMGLRGEHRWVGTRSYDVVGGLDVSGPRNGMPAKLSIEAGARVTFADRGQLRVGSASDRRGALELAGTAGNPVEITSASGQPGRWVGIYFGPGTVSRTTSLRNCVIENGGQSSNGILQIDNAAPTIDSCRIRGSSKHGIRLSDNQANPQIRNTVISQNAGNGVHADGANPQPVLSGNRINGNQGYPVSAGARVVDRIAPDNDLSGNGKDAIRVYGMRLSGNHLWVGERTYEITSSLEVSGPPNGEPARLDILAGAVLKFADRAVFRVGPDRTRRAALRVRGRPDRPVTFTAFAGQPGRWSGLRFDEGTVGAETRLEACVVEFAGAGDRANIFINRAAPQISGCEIARSSEHGIRLSDNGLSAPVLRNNRIIGNAKTGVVSDGISPLPVLNGNLIANNGARPMTLGARAIKNVGKDNRLTGNGTPEIRVFGGRLNGVHDWPALAPYRIEQSIAVHGEPEAPPAELNLAAGSELRFAARTELRIGSDARRKGILRAAGRANATVRFTGQRDTPGAWRGLRFSDGTVDDLTELTHCEVLFGGEGMGGQVLVEASAPRLSNCVISDSREHGIRLTNSSASSPALNGNLIARNGKNGLHSDGNLTNPALSGNQFADNGGRPIVMSARSVRNMDDLNTFSGNGTEVIGVHGGSIGGQNTWAALVPYDILSDISVIGGSPEAPAELVLSPGVELRFSARGRLRIGGSNTQHGRLIAAGDAGNPIVFTARSGAPRGWGGILVDDGAVDDDNLLEHCRVEFAGDRLPGAVTVQRSSATIRHCVFAQGINAAISTRDGFTGILASDIAGYPGGVRHEGSGSTRADFLWWGDAAGPGEGSSVPSSGPVTATAWLTAPISDDRLFRTANVTPDRFSSQGGEAEISVLAGSDLAWQWALSDPGGQVLATASGQGTEFIHRWDGTDNQGAPLGDGTYQYTLSGEESAGGAAIGIVGKIDLDQSLAIAVLDDPSANDLMLATDRILPSGTASGADFKSYRLEIGDGHHPVQWQVLANGATAVENARFLDQPVRLPDARLGLRTLRLSVLNAGDVPATFLRRINTIKRPELTLSDLQISPNGDGRKDRVTATAELGSSADWRLDARRLNGEIIRSQSGRSRRALFDWDGKHQPGAVVRDGTYQLALTVFQPDETDELLTASQFVDIDQRPPLAELSSPLAGEVHAGELEVRGTLFDIDFDQWTLELGEETAPARFVELARSTLQADDERIARIDLDEVAAGPVTLRLTAFDLAGNRTRQEVAFTVLRVDGAGQKLALSPNDDGFSDDVTLAGILSDVHDWQVEITDDDGQLVRSVRGTGESLSVVWDGRDVNGAIVTDGDYWARLTITLPDGRLHIIDRFAEIALDTTGPALALTAPAAGAEVFNTVDIVGTAVDPQLVRRGLHLFDADERVLAEFAIGDAPVDNDVLTAWVTGDFANQPVTGRLSAMDELYNRSESRVSWRIDNLIITEAGNQPRFFDPDAGETTTFSYTLSHDADVTIELLQRDPESGDVLSVPATALKGAPRQAGQNTDSWDGTKDTGELVPATYYPYRISGLGAGGRQAEFNTAFPTAIFEPSIGKDAFILQNIQVVPKGADLEIVFDLAQDSRIDIQLGENRKEGLLHHVLQDHPLPSGSHRITWQMRNTEGELVRPKGDQGRIDLSIAVKGAPLGPSFVAPIAQTADIAVASIDNILLQPSYDEAAALNYRLGRGVSEVKLAIIEPDGNHFRTLQGPADAGLHAIAWDGRDAAGRLGTNQGDYRFTLTAFDRGQAVSEVTGAFILKGHYQLDQSGRKAIRKLVIEEVRDDANLLLGIAAERTQ